MKRTVVAAEGVNLAMAVVEIRMRITATERSRTAREKEEGGMTRIWHRLENHRRRGRPIRRSHARVSQPAESSAEMKKAGRIQAQNK